MIPRRGYADGPYGQIHYRQSGDGMPLLLLHQAPASSAQFDAVYAPLAARGFRAIGVDMPGFGLSDATDFVPTIADYAHIVPAVLDALGIARADLLGHHTGALVANEAAVLFPERIRAVVLNGPMPITPRERQKYLATGHRWELGFTARSGGAHLAELFAIREAFAAGSVPLSRISDYVVQGLLGTGKFWYGHHAAFQYSQDERLRDITQPTLLLTNTGDMIYRHALRARAIRPDFTFVALDGGGVDIVDQQPEAWTAAVTAFLESCPS